MNVSGWFHLSQGKTFETGVVFWRSGWPIHNALVNLTPKGNWNVVVRGIPAAIYRPCDGNLVDTYAMGTWFFKGRDGMVYVDFREG